MKTTAQKPQKPETKKLDASVKVVKTGVRAGAGGSPAGVLAD